MRDHVLRRTMPGSASIICTHLWVARQILAEALGEQQDHGFGIQLPTGSISVVDFPDGTWPFDLAEEEYEIWGRGAPSRALARVVGYRPATGSLA